MPWGRWPCSPYNCLLQERVIEATGSGWGSSVFSWGWGGSYG